MTAGGGTGGQTRTCKNRLGSWKCGGGNPSPGGVATIDSGLEARRYYSSFSGDYGQGYTGTNVITSNNYSTAGAGIPVNGVYYGAGGRGKKDCRRDNCAENGTRGTFSLARHDIYGGKGGSAAIPVVIPIPRIEGYLKIKVGAGGAQFFDLSKNGEPTIVEVYNSASKFLRQYVAQGGIVGAQNTEKTPTAGDPSLWNNTGGGSIGTCTEGTPSYVTYETKEVEVETNKCLIALGIATSKDYVIGFKDLFRIEDQLYKERAWVGFDQCYAFGKRDEITFGQYPDSYGIFPLSLYLFRSFGSAECVDVTGCSPDAAKILLDLDEKPDETVCVSKVDDLSKYAKTDIDSPDYAEKLIDAIKESEIRKYWTFSNFEYDCLSYEKKKQTIQSPVFHPAVPPTCERAGNGKFFGAGGGGGAASDTVGVAGEGGFGAPGLVIIEW